MEMASINSLWLRLRCWAPRGSCTGAPSGESRAGTSRAAAAAGGGWREGARGVEGAIAESGCRVWVLVGVGRGPRLTSHHVMLGPLVAPHAGDPMREVSHTVVLPSCASHLKAGGTSEEAAVYLMVLVEASDDVAVRKEALGGGVSSWELTPVLVKEGTSDESSSIWGNADGSRGGATKLYCAAAERGAEGLMEEDRDRMVQGVEMSSLSDSKPLRRSFFVDSATTASVLVGAEPCSLASDQPGLVREVLRVLACTCV